MFAGLAAAASAQAVGDAGWKTMPTPNLNDKRGYYLNGVSCASATSCQAVGLSASSDLRFSALVESWNGKRWDAHSVRATAGATPSGLSGVSCVSRSVCMAVGLAGKPPLALLWNGAKWTRTATEAPPAKAGRLAGVSCASAATCMAVGESITGSSGINLQHPLAELWNGGMWKIADVAEPGGYGALTAVSCTSASECIAVGYSMSTGVGRRPLAERWNGSSWAVEQVPAPAAASGAELSGVSCSSPSASVAVGNYSTFVKHPLAETWNGQSWNITPTPSDVGVVFEGISCPAATACWAVARNEQKERSDPLAGFWDGSTWTLAVTLPGQRSHLPGHKGTLAGISCATTSACVAVGGVPGSGTGAAGSVPLVERYRPR
jgi:hypothetical protein